MAALGIRLVFWAAPKGSSGLGLAKLPTLHVLTANPQTGWGTQWVAGRCPPIVHGQKHRCAAGARLEPTWFCSGLGVGDFKEKKARASALGVGRGTDG